MQQRVRQDGSTHPPQDPLAELARLIGTDDLFSGPVSQECRDESRGMARCSGPYTSDAIHSAGHEMRIRRMVHEYGHAIASELGFLAVEEALSGQTGEARRDWGRIYRSVLDFRPGRS